MAYTGDPEQLREDHFLTLLNVTEEVEYMQPAVAAGAAELLATLRPSFYRQQRPLSVECKKCEYRVETEPSGFLECWGSLGEHTPHIFDLYFGTTLKRSGENLFQQLIDCGQTSLVEMEDADCCNVKGGIGTRNERQLIQLRCTLAGEELQDARLSSAHGAAEVSAALHRL